MSSYPPTQPLHGSITAATIAPKAAVTAARPGTNHGYQELLTHLTMQIAQGCPLEAVVLIDRLLAGINERRDPAVVADLRILRNVAELELTRQRSAQPDGATDVDGPCVAGTVAMILEFADRILPALQHVSGKQRHSIVTEQGGEDRTRHDWFCAAQPPRVLSDRKFEVLRLVAIGMSNRRIAETLYISEGTVKKHLSNVLAKLGAENRTEAVAIARGFGMLE